MELRGRAVAILDRLVRDYIITAAPVSSSYLQKALNLDISSATIRSILYELDELGFLSQPHTSAGRVPTQRAYRFFVDNLMAQVSPRNAELCELERTFSKIKRDDPWIALSALTQQLSQQLCMAVISSVQDGPTLRTVSSQLFQKPEFRDPEFTMSFSELFDIDGTNLCRLSRLRKGRNVQVYIGNENPFSNLRGVSVFTAQFPLSRGSQCHVAAFGPMRVDYEEITGVFKYLFDI